LLKPIYFGKRRFFRWSELQKLAKTGVSLESEPRQAAARINELCARG